LGFNLSLSQLIILLLYLLSNHRNSLLALFLDIVDFLLGHFLMFGSDLLHEGFSYFNSEMGHDFLFDLLANHFLQMLVDEGIDLINLNWFHIF